MAEITSEVATGSSRKLRPRYEGPLCVSQVLLNYRYEVGDLRESGKLRTVMAADRLKHWEGVPK